MFRLTRLAVITLAATLLLDAGPASAELAQELVTATRKLRATALGESDAYAIVESLVTEVGPRLAGSPGDAKAVDWALRTLTDLGFENVRAESMQVPYWERGSLRVLLTSPSRQPLVAASLGGSIGTPETPIEAEVVRVESLEQLSALAPQEVAERIVFIDKRMERHRTGRGYSATVPIRRDGPSIAARHGAVATVIRSVGTDNDRVAHTGMTAYDPASPRIPAIALSNPDADSLARHLQRGTPVRLSLYSTARDLGSARSANVIGEITGAQRPDEIVLLGAHLDAWDLGSGAIDDGAGVAIVTEAARLIGAHTPRPARTIRVVLFANEEFGLTGAKHYRDLRASTIERHIVGMESDFGAGRVWRFSTRVATERLAIVDAIAGLLAPLGIEPGDNNADGGADLKYLREAGMPVFSLNQDGTDYFDYHHTLNDTLDKIDPAALQQNVAAMAVVAYVAASITEDFGRLTVSDAAYMSR